MEDRDFINSYNLKDYDVELENAALVNLKKRQKNSKDYNCFCVRAGYNEDYISFIHDNDYNASYVKQTKERAIDADKHDINYVVTPLKDYFKLIIVDKKCNLKKIDGYEKVNEDKTHRYFRREPKMIPVNVETMMFESDKEINKESLINILESKLSNPEMVIKVSVLNENMEWANLDKYHNTLYTSQKELIFKINLVKEYNYICMVFNVEYGIIDAVSYGPSRIMKQEIQAFKNRIVVSEEIVLKNK